jgi:hypothetical protein
MNPTVMAAAIGVGGTVIVGVAGFSATVWNARKTVGQAHESRVWDRRADVYVDALSAVNYRQFSRQAATMPNHPAYTKIKKNAEEYLATHEPPDWPQLEARLQAFASEPVFTAVQTSSAAHNDALSNHRIWQILKTHGTSETGVIADADDAKGIAAAAVDAEKSLKAAEAADDAVVDLIRTELQGRGRPLGDWQPTIPTNPAPESPR